MIKHKSLSWFLAINFAISWPLFLAPLGLQRLEPTTHQYVTMGLWALAMWGPGLAAIITTLAIIKQPFKSLRLNTLGPKCFYLWAWFLPPLLTALTGALTALMGIGQLDSNFTFVQQLLEQSDSQPPLPLSTLVILQIVQALTFAPLFNLLFAMGEEIGWRGFLLPRLMPLGQWKALLISGGIWGLWHAPAIAQGHNYPDHPILGMALMTVFCIFLGIIFGWMYLNTRSPWVAGLAHGSLNASVGLPYLFLLPGFDTALGGTLTSITGWLVLGLFVGWLVLTNRLPVQVQGDAQVASAK